MWTSGSNLIDQINCIGSEGDAIGRIFWKDMALDLGREKGKQQSEKQQSDKQQSEKLQSEVTDEYNCIHSLKEPHILEGSCLEGDQEAR